MQVLFLTNLLPYPLDNGGKIKTYTTLTALKKGNYDIDLLCFKESNSSFQSEEDELSSVCASIKQIIQRITTAENKKYMMMMAVKSLFSSLPLSSYKFVSEEMKKEILSRKDNDYSCIYYDHLPMFVYYPLCKKLWPNAKHILDEHNCEATIMRRNAESASNPLKKIFMSFELRKVERFESKSLLAADSTIVLSNEDYQALRETAGKDFKHYIIPIGVIDKGIKKETNTGEAISILFVGTLTWEPNNQGLVWFLDNVLPLIENEDIKYHLYIVGKNPSVEVVEKTKGNNDITITGYVESVDEYYDKSDCTIVPLFIGSGQRVKLIEAFSKGIPAISTSIGAEGLAYEKEKSILIADTADEFLHCLLSIKSPNIKKLLSKESRKVYDKYYSIEVIEKKILKVVDLNNN